MKKKKNGWEIKMKTSKIVNFIEHYKVILIVSLMETIQEDKRNQMESAGQKFMERTIPTCIVLAINGIFSNGDPFKASMISLSTRVDMTRR